MLTKFEQDLLNYRRKFNDFDDFFSNYQTEKLKKEENKGKPKYKYIDIPENIKENKQISRYVGKRVKKNGDIQYVFYERKDHITSTGRIVNKWTDVTKDWPEWVNDWAHNRIKEHSWDLK